MKKSEFIKILKVISTTLDGENIKHDIPFSYINKDNFEYIDILIPDHIATYDISRIFNCYEIREKKGIITTKINNLPINFIKTSEKEWSYTFHYYNWDIVHVLVDILMSENFNLRYTRNGLKYKYDEKTINVSKNLYEIFDFLELKFFMVYKGFPTLESIFMFILDSPYFDTDYFTLENFKKYDKNYIYNKQMYENFINYIPQRKGEVMTSEQKVVFIDVCFPDIKILEKIYELEIKKEFPELKNKELFIKSKKEVKKKEVKKIKKKKINLRNYRKDDPDFDFKIV